MSFDMAPPDGAANLQTVAAVLPELGYADSYFRTARAAVNKAAKVFGLPLARVPASRVSTASRKSATWRRKTRPVAVR